MEGPELEDPDQGAPILRIVYSSRATQGFDSESLLRLLETARENNLRANVSGILLYAEGTFLQVLEGDSEVVESLYDKIEEDRRHHDTRVLLRVEDDVRAFGDWTMGFVKATKELRQSMAGLNDFLSSDLARADIATHETTDRVRKILDQFKEGRWRREIEG